ALDSEVIVPVEDNGVSQGAFQMGLDLYNTKSIERLFSVIPSASEYRELAPHRAALERCAQGAARNGLMSPDEAAFMADLLLRVHQHQASPASSAGRPTPRFPDSLLAGGYPDSVSSSRREGRSSPG